MCREHGDALLAEGGSIVPASPDLPIWVCIELNTLGKEATQLSVRHQAPHLGSRTQKTEVVNIVQTQKWSILYRLRAGAGSSVSLAAAVSSRESCG
jgi:hypothetical protein